MSWDVIIAKSSKSAHTFAPLTEAADMSLDRPVFLKMAHNSEDPLGASIVEAHVHQWRALARQNVPGMPTIFNIGQEADCWFLTTEWIQSPSLRALSNIAPGTIADPARFLVSLVERCLIILGDLHACGFVHADISSGNILASPSTNLQAVFLVDHLRR